MTAASSPPDAGEHDRYLAAYDRVVAICSLADGVFGRPPGAPAVRAALAGLEGGTPYEDYLTGHQRHWEPSEGEPPCCGAQSRNSHEPHA